MSKRRRSATNIQPKIPAAFIEELFGCADGHALVRKHLSIGPAALILGVSTALTGIEMEWSLGSSGGVLLSDPVLDYLEEGLIILGLPDVASTVKISLPLTLMQFNQAVPSIDLKRMQQNVRAMELLLTT